MLSSSRHRALVSTVILLALGARAQGQQPAQGFAVERFYLSAPGAGWFVMDALDMHGGLGGSLSLTVGYARNPLRLTNATQRVAIISQQAVMDIGAAVTYDRWRIYLNLDAPLAVRGESGTIGGYSFTGPSLDLGSNPDTLSDPRVGVDIRIIGGPTSRFRLGAGAQLFFPNGNRADYDTDGTYRGMGRVLFAGDEGALSYAGQLGVHVRPLNDMPAPGSPRGSELLFGVAGGAKLPVGRSGSMAVIVGPELFGATAFRSLFGSTSTALEGLLTARLEGTGDNGVQLRVKLGAGAGINQQFGAPQWRVVCGIEVFNRNHPR
jgi:hypothetical protein